MNYEELNKDMKGMNTKKSILFWWKQLGHITKRINDLQSFYRCIDLKSIKIEEVYIGEKSKQIFLGKKTWKYTLLLYFRNNECYKIVGF